MAGQIKQLPRTHHQELKASARRLAKDLPSLPGRYVKSLFPITGWLPSYQLEWLWGDFVAGLTVGLVAVPQSISYASKLAGLPAQFGLYTSFIGALLYALFATSKGTVPPGCHWMLLTVFFEDVTIGPTAVLSLGVGQALSTYASGASTADQVVFALTLAFWTGIIQLIIGLFRFGIIIDFVPIPVISGFTAGAGIQVIISQLPTLVGIKTVNTNNAPIQVLIDFFKALSTATEWDSIFGITSLAFILLIKFSVDYAVKKRGITWLKYVGFLKNTIVLIIYTGISYAVKDNKNLSFSIVKTIPYGLTGIQQANYSISYASTVFQALPGIVVISVLEHIAVVKTYGRVNGYTTNPNQEIVAMGLANSLGSLVGAFPATGSFSRSAIKAASGVRSPVASFITGIIVVICLFSLTNALYYIPSAVLSSIVVNSVADLVEKGKLAIPLFKSDIFDFLGFVVGFIVVIVSSLENAIYASVAWSLLVLLFRIARPRVEILGRTATGAWIDPTADDYDSPATAATSSVSVVPETSVPTGILVLKIDEALTYPNSNYILAVAKNAVLHRFKYTNTETRRADKSWSDTTQEQYKALEKKKGQDAAPPPNLRAVVLDFSNVTHVDFSGFQTLLDLKDDLERYAGYPIPFYFAAVRRTQIRLLLGVPLHVIGADRNAVAGASEGQKKKWFKFKKTPEEVAAEEQRDIASLEYFFTDLDSAVEAAVSQTTNVVLGDKLSANIV
ncbi:hypothetical protein HDU82_007469 [Entophlyctis luteolus]|nr:hypothetical protein HDU82_007469 [Entophlyctis luteolus]